MTSTLLILLTSLVMLDFHCMLLDDFFPTPKEFWVKMRGALLPKMGRHIFLAHQQQFFSGKLYVPALC